MRTLITGRDGKGEARDQKLSQGPWKRSRKEELRAKVAARFPGNSLGGFQVLGDVPGFILEYILKSWCSRILWGVTLSRPFIVYALVQEYAYQEKG